MSDLSNFLPRKKKKKASPPLKDKKIKPRIIDRKKSPGSLEELSKEQLIDLLEPLISEIPGYASNLAWTRQKVLPKKPDIHPEELAEELVIPVLVAYMILAQLQPEQD
jgi:hypothetical protein